jgi:hypothetical protein
MVAAKDEEERSASGEATAGGRAEVVEDDGIGTGEMAGSEEAAESADRGEEKTTRELEKVAVFLEVGVEGIDDVEEADGAAVGRDDSVEETARADAAE